VDDLIRRSKIEICIEILSILNQRGLSRITHIMYNTNTNCSLLKEILVFMMKQNLVEEKSVGKDRVAYCITQRGISILNAFQELNQILPLVENKVNKISDYV
jgi:predicted transcriptional regulator